MSKPFEDKFGTLPQELQENIRKAVVKHGQYKAAKMYLDIVSEQNGMSFQGLYSRLKRIAIAELGEGAIQQTRAGKKREDGTRRLTQTELKMLEDVRNGKVSINEVSKVIAAQALQKMLENPNDVKFIDFYRTELMRMKQDEIKETQTAQQGFIDAIFAGKVPEKCSKCGHQIFGK